VNPPPPSLSACEQIDALCVEFERGWKTGKPTAPEEVLRSAPEELRAPLLEELLRVEVHHRRLRGEAPEVAEYLARFPDLAAAVRAALAAPAEVGAAAGSLVGPYRLLHQLGEGGMGVVYVAEQETPVRRQVALKVIKPGMDSAQVVARFEAERQVLALMDHPHIARVFDGGTTAAGLPYFVMELVPGAPITRYCDDHQLTPRERLELFVPVCQAVQHAHQKGIIHRDLKPSNVLVAEQDGRPSPKVIDFGIAKALGQRLGDYTSLTRLGQVVGTFEYMSPEQAALTGLDVDTRSDVYSLGVLLYELLTGEPPFGRRRFREAALLEMLRVIREEEPPRPSVRLRKDEGGRMKDESKTTRRTGWHRLWPFSSFILHPSSFQELDWIVMKTLEKDRGRRYETAAALARDVQRYLADEPVEAGPPSTAYRLRKFARKHRKALAVAAAFALLLVAGALVSAWLAVRAALAEHDAEAKRDEAVAAGRRAADEAAVAEAVTAFLRHDLLAQAGPGPQAEWQRAPDPNLRVRAVLDRAAERVAGRFDGQPLVEAAVRLTIGNAYRDLGLDRLAGPHLERAHALYHRLRGPDDPATWEAAHELGQTYSGQCRFAAAEGLLAAALEKRDRRLGPTHADTLRTADSLGRLYLAWGKYDRAEELFTRTLQARRADPQDTHALESVNNLALLHRQRGRHRQAREFLRRALEDCARKHPGDHPDALSLRHNLAIVLGAEGKTDEALRLALPTLEARRRVLGEDHPHTLMSRINLAALRKAQGKFAEAEQLLLEARRRSLPLGKGHLVTLICANDLALLYQALGRLPEAEQLAAETLKEGTAALGPGHPEILPWILNRAELYRVQGKYDLALALVREGTEAGTRVLGKDHPALLFFRHSLCQVHVAQGKVAAAEPLAVAVYEEGKRRLGAKHPDVLVWMHELASLYFRLGKLDRAEPLARRCLDFFTEVWGEDHPNLPFVLNNLALIFQARGRLDEAAPLALRAYQTGKRHLGPRSPDVLIWMVNLGQIYTGLRQLDRAEPLVRQAYEAFREGSGDRDLRTLIAGYRLSAIYLGRGKLGPAEALAARVYETGASTFGEDSPDVAVWRSHLARVCAAREDYPRAETLFARSVETLRRGPAHARGDLGLTLMLLGEVRLKRGHHEKAEAALRDCLGIWQKASPGGANPFWAQSLLGAALLGQKQYAAAEPLLQAGFAGLDGIAGKEPQAASRRQEAAERIVQLYEAWGKPGRAGEWRNKR
jgi:non-specific serine/threonine protein kinase/serine/threonine-protein kinase